MQNIYNRHILLFCLKQSLYYNIGKSKIDDIIRELKYFQCDKFMELINTMLDIKYDIDSFREEFKEEICFILDSFLNSKTEFKSIKNSFRSIKTKHDFFKIQSEILSKLDSDNTKDNNISNFAKKVFIQLPTLIDIYIRNTCIKKMFNQTNVFLINYIKKNKSNFESISKYLYCSDYASVKDLINQKMLKDSYLNYSIINIRKAWLAIIEHNKTKTGHKQIIRNIVKEYVFNLTKSNDPLIQKNSKMFEKIHYWCKDYLSQLPFNEFFVDLTYHKIALTTKQFSKPITNNVKSHKSKIKYDIYRQHLIDIITQCRKNIKTGNKSNSPIHQLIINSLSDEVLLISIKKTTKSLFKNEHKPNNSYIKEPTVLKNIVSKYIHKKYSLNQLEILELLQNYYVSSQKQRMCISIESNNIKFHKIKIKINLNLKTKPNSTNEKTMIKYFHKLDKQKRFTNCKRRIIDLRSNNGHDKKLFKVDDSLMNTILEDNLIDKINNKSKKNKMRLSQTLNMRMYIINIVTSFQYNEDKKHDYLSSGISTDQWHEFLEYDIQQYLISHEVKFFTEHQLKEIPNHVYYYRNYRSPDMYILDDLFINKRLVRWIDAKNVFGGSLYHKDRKKTCDFNSQINSYVENFGPGAIVFGHGFSLDFVKLLKKEDNFNQKLFDKVLFIDALDFLDNEYVIPWIFDIEPLPTDKELINAYTNKKIFYLDKSILSTT